MAADESTIAVVGGGIAGTSVAAHLASLGRASTVFERGDLGGETTARSAAFFGAYGTPLERRLKRYGMRVYNDLFDDGRRDLRYEHVGRLRVATSADGGDALRHWAESNRGVRILEPDDVHDVVLAPHLETDAIEVATYRPHVGYLRPRPLAEAFAARARERAETTIRTGTVVDRIDVDGGRVEGVVVDGEPVEAEHVVCAAGPWNVRLLDDAGVELPLGHSLAPVLRVDLDEPGYTLPVVSHHESGVYARGDGDGTALLGRYPPEPDLDARLDPDEVPDVVPDGLAETIRSELGDLLPAVADASVLEEWVGVRSHTPDGHPIAGEVKEGLSLAAFDSSGIQLSPAVGRTIARGIAGREDPFADSLRPGRVLE